MPSPDPIRLYDEADIPLLLRGKATVAAISFNGIQVTVENWRENLELQLKLKIETTNIKTSEDVKNLFNEIDTVFFG